MEMDQSQRRRDSLQHREGERGEQPGLVSKRDGFYSVLVLRYLPYGLKHRSTLVRTEYGVQW